MNAKTAVNSNQRQVLISKLIHLGGVESQAHLVELLAKAGVKVTQATASRDLEDLGAIRSRDVNGELQYVINSETAMTGIGSASNLAKLIVGVTASGNLAVVRTPPGGAQLLASAIDRNFLNGALKSVIGTIAGDDTVLVISKSSSGGSALAKSISNYATKSAGPKISNGKRK